MIKAFPEKVGDKNVRRQINEDADQLIPHEMVEKAHATASALIWTAIMPCQVSRKSMDRTPEQRLHLAIVETALRDLLTAPSHLADEAIRWFSGSFVSPISFVHCADVLDFDADYVRDRVRRYVR